MRLAWLSVLSLGIAGAVHAAGVAVPVSVQGCATGWGQLLSPEQQAQIAPARGCQAANIHEQGRDPSPNPMDARTIVFPLGSRAPLDAVAIAPHLPGKGAPAPSSKRQLASGQIQSGSRPVALAPLIDRVAQAHDIDPLLLHAIARVESRHQSGALSPAGAHGLMQVMAPTARQFGLDDARELQDPSTNLEVSARYLKNLQSSFGNDLPLVLAAYNAGEGAVKRYGGRVPPYRETQGYVRKVLAEYDLLLRVSARQSAAVTLPRTDS
jgi:lysozyme